MYNYYVANQKHALIIPFKIETKKTKEVRNKINRSMKLWWWWWWAMKTQKEKKALTATLFNSFFFKFFIQTNYTVFGSLFIVPVNEMSKTWVNNWVQSSHNIDFIRMLLDINAHEESMNSLRKKNNNNNINSH